MPRQTLDYALPVRRRGIFALLTTKSARRALRNLLLGAMVYVGSYVVLSLGGRFEPSTTGLRGVEGSVAISVRTFIWKPAGFSNHFKTRWSLVYFYLPIYFLDIHFWHGYEDAYGRKYPTSEPSNATEWRAWSGK